MMAKIHLAMTLVSTGRGDQMNGHGNTCYIQNKKHRNVMRVDYRNGSFTVWADSSRNITKLVLLAYKEHLDQLRKEF